MEMNFYIDEDVAEKLFEVKATIPELKNLTANEFAKEIVSIYVREKYKRLELEIMSNNHYN